MKTVVLAAVAGGAALFILYRARKRVGDLAAQVDALSAEVIVAKKLRCANHPPIHYRLSPFPLGRSRPVVPVPPSLPLTNQARAASFCIAAGRSASPACASSSRCGR